MQALAIRAPSRLLILAMAGLTLLLLALAFDGATASAAPQLQVSGACEPDPVRTGPAVMTCTVEVTNSGDETATNVETSLFLSPNCGLPTPAIPPLLYLYIDGVLQVDDSSLPLGAFLGDLNAGQTKEIVTKIVLQNLLAGIFGGELTVTADGLSATPIDLCWTVDPAAADPTSDISLHKRLISPAPGTPGIINEATYEITVRNNGSQSATSLSLIELLPFGFEVASANPAPSGSDALGRPTWDLSGLAAGAEADVSLTVRVLEGVCAPLDNIAVTQTTIGGQLQEHAAFADRVIVLGDCSEPPPPPEPEWCLYWSPDESEAWEAPCDEPICWALTPGSDFYQPAFDCEAEYCWYYPPGEGSPPVLNLCGEDVCWINAGDDFDFYFDVPCDEEFCEYIAPDGSESTNGPCDFPICWTSPPEGGRWEVVFGCGEFGEECWATPPSGAPSVFVPCDFEPCFLVPPPGAITFGFGDFPAPCEFAEGLCWPMPAVGGEVFTYPVPCEAVESFCVVTPPGGGLSFVLSCEEIAPDTVCWEIDEEIAELLGVPPDTLLPRPCGPGEEPTIPEPPVSVPAEPVLGTLTPAELVQGTVETALPEPSSSVEGAALEPSSRVEQIGGPPTPPPTPTPDDNKPPTDPNNPPGNDNEIDGPEDLSDVLGFGRPPPTSIAGPDAGLGPPHADDTVRWFAVVGVLAASALGCASAGLIARRGRR